MQAAAAQPGNLAGMLSLAEGEQQLTAALRNLNVAVEAYPELRAEQTVKDLHEELAGTENRVSFARQAYNDAVMEYNNARETFPASLFAAFFGHPHQFFFGQSVGHIFGYNQNIHLIPLQLR